MKRIKLFPIQFILLTLAGSLILGLSACSKKISFSKSSIVPAAEGKVKVKKDKNNNYSVSVSVDNLAQPKDLTPSRSTYVVWMETPGNATKNIGQLNTSGGFLSKKLKASLSTVSSFKPTRIFITAENDGTISYPQGITVLTTSSF